MPGEAVVVTTDALGRQVSTTVPFYVTSSLLQKGLSDFSVAAGTLRRDYALKDFSYGPGVSAGSLRYGVSDSFTLESHAEAADSLTLGGLGGNLRLGNFGVLNSAVSQSRFDGEGGQQLSLGYQYSNQRFSFSYQRLQRHAQYADLTVVDSPYISLSRRSEQATLSLNLDRWGSLGAGYFDVRAADDSRTRLLNLSWSKPLWRNSSFYLSANREIGDSNWAVQAQLVIPFDLRGSLALSSERSKTGQTQQRVNYSRAVPTEGGVGFNLGYAKGDGAGLPTGRRDLASAISAIAGRRLRHLRRRNPLGRCQRFAGVDGSAGVRRQSHRRCVCRGQHRRFRRHSGAL